MNKIIYLLIIVAMMLFVSCSKDYNYYYELGKSSYDSLSYYTAIEHLSKSIELQQGKENIKAYRLRGKCYLEIQDHDAFDDYNYLITSGFADYNDYIGRGLANFRMYKPELAIKDFSEAISLNDTSIIAYTERGNLYMLKSEYDKALNDYLKAITIKPDDFEVLRFVGFLYNRQEKYDLSYDYLTRSININAKIPSTYFHRSVSLVKMNRFEEAISDLTEAIKLDTSDADLFKFRGDIYYAKNEGGFNAVNDWLKAVKLNPNKYKDELMPKIDKAFNNIDKENKELEGYLKDNQKKKK